MNLNHTRETDNVLRFERLEHDLADLLPRIGIDPDAFALWHVNSTGKRQGRDYRNFYDDRTRATVQRVFARELSVLNYSFEPEAA